jgi:hypothetical protein
MAGHPRKLHPLVWTTPFAIARRGTYATFLECCGLQAVHIGRRVDWSIDTKPSPLSTLALIVYSTVRKTGVFCMVLVDRN